MSWTVDVNVAIALIYNPAGRILITQRAPHIPSGGLWEFPGGKLEPHETPAEALLREIKEEVNLEIVEYDFIQQITTQRMDDTLHLYVFLVHQFHGQAEKREGQTDLRWVDSETLSQYEFPPTNTPILIWIMKNRS